MFLQLLVFRNNFSSTSSIGVLPKNSLFIIAENYRKHYSIWSNLRDYAFFDEFRRVVQDIIPWPTNQIPDVVHTIDFATPNAAAIAIQLKQLTQIRSQAPTSRSNIQNL